VVFRLNIGELGKVPILREDKKREELTQGEGGEALDEAAAYKGRRGETSTSVDWKVMGNSKTWGRRVVFEGKNNGSKKTWGGTITIQRTERPRQERGADVGRDRSRNKERGDEERKGEIAKKNDGASSC